MAPPCGLVLSDEHGLLLPGVLVGDTIRCQLPAAAEARTMYLLLSTTRGVEWTMPAMAFRVTQYNASSAPTVSRAEAAFGDFDGGSSVLVSGTNYAPENNISGRLACLFGDAPAVPATFVRSTVARCIAPPARKLTHVYDLSYPPTTRADRPADPRERLAHLLPCLLLYFPIPMTSLFPMQPQVILLRPTLSRFDSGALERKAMPFASPTIVQPSLRHARSHSPPPLQKVVLTDLRHASCTDRPGP